MSETLQVILCFALIIAVVYMFIHIANKARKSGGGIMTSIFGATYEFYGKDKREAIQEIVELKAHKKMEEQSTDKPVDDTPKQK